MMAVTFGGQEVVLYSQLLNPTTNATYILMSSTIPAGTLVNDGDYELGIRIISTVDGFINAIRYYKAVGETGTHVGRIWSSGGVLQTSVTFTNETASGWQEQVLATPFFISANTAYVVSVNTNTAYVYTTQGLASTIRNGFISSSGTNGLFNNTVGSFPTSVFNNNNYFRDIVFVATSPSLVSTSSNTANNTNTITVTKPVNCNNRLLIATVVITQGTSISTITATGWTLIDTRKNYSTFLSVATYTRTGLNSDSDYVFSFSSSVNKIIVGICCFSQLSTINSFNSRIDQYSTKNFSSSSINAFNQLILNIYTQRTNTYLLSSGSDYIALNVKSGTNIRTDISLIITYKYNVTGSNSNTLTIRSGKDAILIVNDYANLTVLDNLIITELTSLGYNVTSFSANTLGSNLVNACNLVDVVYVSDSVNSTDLSNKLVSIDTGLILSKSTNIWENHLMSNTGTGSYIGNTIYIQNNTHPITTGFSVGNITTYGSNSNIHFSSSTIGTGGIKLTQKDNSITTGTIICYEKGSLLVDNSNATARRIGNGVGDITVFNSNAFTLFRNSIDWASRYGDSPQITQSLAIS